MRKWIARLLQQSPPPQNERRKPHSRLGVEALESRDVPSTVIFSDTYYWLQFGPSATITVTVTEDKAGYEGLFHWNYHVQNGVFSDDIGNFAISVGDPEGIENLDSSLSWDASIGTLTSDPNLVSWVGEGQANPTIPPSESADFWFTTAPTDIAIFSGFIADPWFGWQVGGQVAAPMDPLKVTTNLDVINWTDGQISLREAIFSATGQDGESVITFDQNVETITLDPTRGALAVALPPEETHHPEVVIDGGSGVTIQRDTSAQQRFGLFSNQAGTTLDLRNLSLVGGDAPSLGGGVKSTGNLYLTNVTINSCYADDAGGGVWFAGNYLGITNSIISGNSATGGSGLGGGIAIEGAATGVLISDSQICCNDADVKGGGIYITEGATTQIGATVTLDNTDVYNNSAGQYGGGIAVEYGLTGAINLTLQGGTEIDDNWLTDPTPQNQRGGGIYLGSGTITLNGVWIGNNTAGNGDGMYRALGTTKVIGNGGVTWYLNGEVVGG